MSYAGRYALQIVLLVCLLFALSAAQSAQPALSPSAAQSPAPHSDDASKEAIILEQNVTKVVYEADGTGTRETAVVMRVQSQAGVQGLAVLSFPYTSYNDQVEVDYVRVRKPDGTVVATPDYNIQDMPGDVTRRAPMYSDIHEKQITVKALGVGDLLEYLVRYRTMKPQVPGHFWYEYTFTKGLIARDEELEVSVARDKYVKVSSPELQPTVKEDGNRRIYSWKTANLDLQAREKLLKKSVEQKPSVQITTFHSWEEVGSWYKELQKSQVAVTPQIQTKVAELTKGLRTDDEKLRALYGFVSTQIHYVSLSFGIGRYQPHMAEDVFENQYGDCKDKHTLLATMLQAAGFEAWPVLIHPTRKLDPDMPSPGQFNHLISVVPQGKTLLWLDTTPEVAPPGLLLGSLRDKQALVMPATGPAVLMTTPAQPPYPSLQNVSTEGKLSSEGVLTMHFEETTRGDAEVLYRLGFRNTPVAQWKDLGQRISNASGFGGDVSNVTASVPEEIDQPFRFAYDYTRKDFSDWSNHRIGAPLPWFGIESAATEEEKPEEPVKLGALGDVFYQSKITLPAGLAPKYSDQKDISEDFADYHATYEIDDGVMTVTRRLTIKKSEVPLASWETYKKFCKVLTEERDRYIDLDNGTTAYPTGEGPAPAVAASTNQSTLADSLLQIGEEAARANPEAKKLLEEGAQAMGDRDATRAEEAFQKLIELDPKYPGAHSGLGIAYILRGNNDGAVQELRKEEEYHPEDPATYKLLAATLQQIRRNDEAVEEYRKLLKLEPGNLDAALAVATALNRQHKYSETVQLLQEALQKSPDSPTLQSQLAYAYLRDHQPEKALPILKKVASERSDSKTLNMVAYALAENNAGLDDATEYGVKALHQAEADSIAAGDDDAGLANTVQLGAIWDTVGWIYFQKGEYDKALPYVRAAWLLLQDGIVGNHLGQLYEKLGNKQAAIHQYVLALSAPSGVTEGNKNEVREHYKKLTGKDLNDDYRPALRRGSVANEFVSPEDELSRTRSQNISAAPHEPGNADFTVIFSPGKAEEVKYVGGKESLKKMAEAISRTKLQTEIPDASPVRVFRRGIVTCGQTGCDFTFLLPRDVHGVDNVFQAN